jgi:hypothetical protein
MTGGEITALIVGVLAAGIIVGASFTQRRPGPATERDRGIATDAHGYLMMAVGTICLVDVATADTPRPQSIGGGGSLRAEDGPMQVPSSVG